MSWTPAPPMPDDYREAVHAYVLEVRRCLYLQHWAIRMPDEWADPPDDVIAQIDPCDGRYLATLRFGTGFRGQSREAIRSTIVHELLHLHHVRLTDIVRLGKYMNDLGQTTFDHMNDQMKREAEYMIDALTTVVEEVVPLPPEWPEWKV